MLLQHGFSACEGKFKYGLTKNQARLSSKQNATDAKASKHKIGSEGQRKVKKAKGSGSQAVEGSGQMRCAREARQLLEPSRMKQERRQLLCITRSATVGIWAWMREQLQGRW